MKIKTKKETNENQKIFAIRNYCHIKKAKENVRQPSQAFRLRLLNKQKKKKKEMKTKSLN